MKLATYKQIPTLIMLLFAAGALATLYLLFGLSNDLALEAGVLSTGEVERVQPFMFRIQVLMTITLAAGFGGLLVLSRQTRVQEVYVEQMRRQEEKEEADRQTKESKIQDLEWIDDLLKEANNDESLQKKVFERLCKKSEAVAGAYYVRDESKFTLTHHYALALGDSQTFSYENGEGLVGQAAKSGKKMVVNEIPQNGMRVVSGLGESAPKNLIILPVVVGGETVAVSEIGTFHVPEKETIRGLEEAHKKFASFLEPKPEKKKTKTTSGKS